jgi:hypothetical protein
VKLAEHYIKFNIVFSFLLDPIHLEEVVREQIAGVEDPECSSAFVEFCTHLSLLCRGCLVAAEEESFFQSIEFTAIR